MSSDSGSSESLSAVESIEEEVDSDDEILIESEILPYQDKPLPNNESASDGDDDDKDIDGLTQAVLEARYEGIMLVNSW